MARKKLVKYDPENGHLIEERELTLEELTCFFDAVIRGGGMYTRRCEMDGFAGEVYASKYDPDPIYDYKITDIE